MNKNNYFRLILLFTLLIPCITNARPTVDDFTRERDYRMAAISPNGQYLAEVWNKHEDNTRIVTIRDLTKAGTPIVGKLADRVVRPNSVSWANDERLLIHVSVPYQTKSVIRDSQKKKDFDIYDYFMFSRTISMNVDGSDPVVLLEDQRRVRWNVNLSRIKHFLPNDPKHVLMSAYRSERLVQYKVNVYNGESEEVIRGGKFTFAFLNDEDGKPLYRLDYKRIAKRIEIFESRGEDDWDLVEKIELDDDDTEEERDRGDFIGLYKNDLVYRKKNEETGFYELWIFNSKDDSYKSLVSVEGKDILFPISSVRTNEVVGYAVDGDLIRYRFFDKQYQEEYDKLAEMVGHYNFRLTSFSRDGKKVVVKVFGRDNPSSYSLYDFKSRSLEFLQNSYFPISMENLSLPAQASYKTRDGLLIRSHILLPQDYKKGQRYPLVILPHGGPHARERADYDDFAQFISTRGYIVMQPNFRGSTGFGKAFEEAGYKQWGGAMQDDLEDAVAFMVSKGYADPARVCIAGISYGGYAALMGVINSPKLYKCAISLNGVTDLPDMIDYDKSQLDDEDLINKYLYQRIGHPEKDMPMLIAKSPARQADKIQVPLLIVAGVDDDVVPFKQAKKLVKTLKKHKKNYRFIELKEVGHNPFYYLDDAREVYTAVEEFLAEHLN